MKKVSLLKQLPCPVTDLEHGEILQASLPADSKILGYNEGENSIKISCTSDSLKCAEVKVRYIVLDFSLKQKDYEIPYGMEEIAIAELSNGLTLCFLKEIRSSGACC